MNLIKPKKLKPGDTIAIIAPSGVVDIDAINKASIYFTNKGYKIKLGENISKTDRYLAGSDADRLSDLHSAFEDNSIDAIICARGGYGALRLANKLDFELIKKHPKIFCGYSDITVLNALLFKQCGLITFSGPMAQSDFTGNTIEPYTEQSFFNALCGNYLEIKPIENKLYSNNSCSGVLIGGNLTTFATLCGLDFVPDEKFILFAEDLNEPVYKIDRAFTQLLNIEKFRQNINGIILGEFTDTDNNAYLEQYFKNLSNELNIPVSGIFPITHSKKKTTIPYGAKAVLQNNIVQISDFTV